jgi:hypothetical protein
MADEIKKRYTAIIDVQEVTEIGEDRPYGSGKDRGVIPKHKDSRELAKLVIRDDTLEGLKDKISKHVELI